jgi:hypothetical protein
MFYIIFFSGIFRNRRKILPRNLRKGCEHWRGCYSIKKEYVGNILKRHSAEISSAYLGRAKYTSKQTPRSELWNRSILENSLEAERVTMLRKSFVGWHLHYSHSSKVAICDAAWGNLSTAGCGSLWMNYRKEQCKQTCHCVFLRSEQRELLQIPVWILILLFCLKVTYYGYYMERRPHTADASKCIESSSVMHNTVYYKGE